MLKMAQKRKIKEYEEASQAKVQFHATDKILPMKLAENEIEPKQHSDKNQELLVLSHFETVCK